VPKDLPANIVVASHRRSGTHLAIDTIRSNILGVNPAFLTLETLLPRHKDHQSLEVFEGQRRSGSAAIVKTHEFPDLKIFADDALLQGYATEILRHSRIVYAVRDGRDVMVSFFEYRRKIDAKLKDVSFAEFIRSPYAGYENPAAHWSAHVKAWLSRRDVLPIYYEDMHEDFEGVVARLATFLDLPRRAEIFDAVISRNAAAAQLSTAVLYRRGKVGDHAQYFTPEDNAFFEREAGEGMAAYRERKDRFAGVSIPPTARKPRFLQINTFYPAYLADFYTVRPHLMNAPYVAQIEALLDDGFADSHIFTRPLRAHGFETMQVVANNGISQGAWLREQGLTTTEPVDSAQATLRQIEAFAPDVVYTTDVETLHAGFFRQVKSRPPVIAGWRGFPLQAHTDLSCYDLILTSFDRIFEEAPARGAKRVERFHPGFPENSPVIREPRNISWDVVISGTVTHQHLKRIQTINMLAEMSRDEFAPFSLGLFMPNASALSPLAQSLNRGALWAHEMLRLLRSARIVVNIDVDAFGAQPPNMRLIEATGAGAFLLTSYHPELKTFFTPGEEIETFRTPQELASKILYYLAEPALCDEMGAKAQARCIAEHGLSKRASWFADIMRAALHRAEV
jgi:hypothetical protein